MRLSITLISLHFKTFLLTKAWCCTSYWVNLTIISPAFYFIFLGLLSLWDISTIFILISTFIYSTTLLSKTSSELFFHSLIYHRLKYNYVLSTTLVYKLDFLICWFYLTYHLHHLYKFLILPSFQFLSFFVITKLFSYKTEWFFDSIKSELTLNLTCLSFFTIFISSLICFLNILCPIKYLHNLWWTCVFYKYPRRHLLVQSQQRRKYQKNV